MRSIHCCMVMAAALAVVWSGPAAQLGRAQDVSTKALFSYQVLSVFQRHCLRCHGDSPKGDIRILDHALLVKERQVVRPGSPETSELFDLVQGGSMPPGNCPKVPPKELELLQEWIRSGAETLPSYHDEAYVLASIVRNLRTLATDEQKRSSRYLSLNHLLARDNARTNLPKQREILKRVVRNLEPIEQTQTVFRIDLRDLGWDQHPYPKAEAGWNRLNFFDLILLEYHGRLPTNSPLYSDLVPFLLLLQEAGQVRPIPYVRADWLAEVITNTESPLYKDFLNVRGKRDNKLGQNEGGQRNLSGREENAEESAAESGTVPRSWIGTKPYVVVPPSLRGENEEKVRPPLSKELLLELLDRDTKSGIAIVPLDGLTFPNHNSTDPLFSIEFKSTDFKELVAAERGSREPYAKDRFVPGEKLGLWVKPSQLARIEICFRGERPGVVKTPVEAGKMLLIPSSDAKGILITELSKGIEKETNDICLFAYTDAELKSAQCDFPEGVLLQAAGINDRVVHPLYQLLPNGQVKQPDPSKMVKVTVTVTKCQAKSNPD